VLPEVALTLIGGEGVGKGILAQALGVLFGRHFKHLEKSGQLTDRFNLMMKDKVLIYADEVFFAGNPAEASNLKTLITEKRKTIEAKFQNPYDLPNYTKLIIASNEQWVVPAGLDARRYAVFQVSGRRNTDYKYFNAIIDQLKSGGESNSGGYEAMLYELLNRDISQFDPRRFPQTEALFQQKQLSFDAATQWWFDCLINGTCGKSRDGTWEKYIPRVYAQDCVADLTHSTYDKDGLETKVGLTLHRLCPEIKDRKKINDVTKKQERVYVLPSLDECRSAFEKVTKSPQINWRTGNLAKPKRAKSGAKNRG
jgi:hypothetical protein